MQIWCMYYNICIYTYVCMCIYVYMCVCSYICIYTYHQVHYRLPTCSWLWSHRWTMEHVQTTRGHTFRENGFFYPPKLSALSSSSVRGGKLMCSLPQSRLLTELILHRSYRQPQPLWDYEHRDRPCSEDTISLQSSWPVVIQHFCPLPQDNLWAFGEGVWYRCPVRPSTKRRHLTWNFGIGSFSWLKCVPQVHVLTT